MSLSGSAMVTSPPLVDLRVTLLSAYKQGACHEAEQILRAHRGITPHIVDVKLLHELITLLEYCPPATSSSATSSTSSSSPWISTVSSSSSSDSDNKELTSKKQGYEHGSSRHRCPRRPVASSSSHMTTSTTTTTTQSSLSSSSVVVTPTAPLSKLLLRSLLSCIKALPSDAVASATVTAEGIDDRRNLVSSLSQKEQHQESLTVLASSIFHPQPPSPHHPQPPSPHYHDAHLPALLYRVLASSALEYDANYDIARALIKYGGIKKYSLINALVEVNRIQQIETQGGKKEEEEVEEKRNEQVEAQEGGALPVEESSVHTSSKVYATALHAAAARGIFENVWLVLRLGGTPSLFIKDIPYGRTPAQVAAQCEHISIADYLLHEEEEVEKEEEELQKAREEDKNTGAGEAKKQTGFSEKP